MHGLPVAPDVDFHSSGSLSDRDSVYHSSIFVLGSVGCSFKLSALRWRKDSSKQSILLVSLKHKLELKIVVHK